MACALPPRPTEWKPLQWLLDTQRWTTGWKLHRCQVTGEQGGQRVNPAAAPPSTDVTTTHAPTMRLAPQILLCSTLYFVREKMSCLVFSPIFRCSNPSRHMCLPFAFTRHRLQHSATFSPRGHHSLCLFPNFLASRNCLPLYLTEGSLGPLPWCSAAGKSPSSGENKSLPPHFTFNLLLIFVVVHSPPQPLLSHHSCIFSLIAPRWTMQG